jgi:hypothetical protein
MKEIMDEMLAVKPEPRLEDIEEADYWLNCNNRPQTIPRWYETVREFLSYVRAEYR